ncbi:hypothetical protein KIPB_011946 [Kipferlia bialata]|uniref:Uncharacterized protein n=1 Tax=Kipferlia bialata TaxID=797122 RepID=A0A9K3D8Z1_9EUKA|nr:hypothetical protein KIPB_011946 [Kipferlia bialata]|eukprot:g11946.t1
MSNRHRAVETTSGRIDASERTEHDSRGQQQKDNEAATVAMLPAIPPFLASMAEGRYRPKMPSLTAVSPNTNLTNAPAVIARTEIMGRSPALTELDLLAVLVNKTQSNRIDEELLLQQIHRADTVEQGPPDYCRSRR